MCAQKIIPSITIDQICGLAINGNIDCVIAFHTFPGFGIQFYKANESKIGAGSIASLSSIPSDEATTTASEYLKSGDFGSSVLFHMVNILPLCPPPKPPPVAP